MLRKLGYPLFCGLVLAAVSAPAQAPARSGYDINYIGPPMADPVMQHSKETYVLFGCSYCHGLYLVARGEATDLMHSRLVGSDENGNVIGPLLHEGIPQTAKLSPMPQFSDLSDGQIADLVRWIHYARQQGRYKEAMEAKDAAPGNAAAGKVYFEQKCSSCHATLTKKYDAAVLKAQILKPRALEAAPSWTLDRLNDAKTAAARKRHGALLENYSAGDVANLVAYLQGVK
jgi:mono/diheme cytochrome c family protein